ncbi:helix-turn-helix transcriptional regulator [Streptomyces sp. NPDC056149]|uniref:helix-turn-helix transcriptional regulator n=1 Tax=Streptomyces sp. NPDC056149 TaxID=3345728 RepID=UPI0035DBEC72
MSSAEMDRQEACRSLFSALRKSVDVSQLGARRHELRDGLWTDFLYAKKSLSQSDMAYLLGVSSGTYEGVERGLKAPSVELLLAFGRICGIRDAATLDRLWKVSLGRPFPRASDLVGLRLPDELRALALADGGGGGSPDAVPALQAAALRAVSALLGGDPAADANPHTGRLTARCLASAFSAVPLGAGAEELVRALSTVEAGLRAPCRDWVVWELRRLGHVESARRLVERGFRTDDGA